jgi:putative ABC transport system permease protein
VRLVRPICRNTSNHFPDLGEDPLMHDLRLALRQLWRQPVFTSIAVLTLAIGMGVNAVAFTVVNGLLFKGFARATSSDVGRIATLPGSDEGGYASLAEYQRFADVAAGTLDLAAEGRLSMAWRHAGTTETAWVLFVTSNYFSMVNARPIVGHLAVARAADGALSVMIGERFWRTKLNAVSLSGLTLRLNDITVGVAGVLPESFIGPAGIYSPDVWLPLDDLAIFPTSSALQKRDHRWLFVLGRLRPGAGVPEAQGRVDAAVAAMADEWPQSHRERSARFRLFNEGNSELRGLRTGAAVAMGIIGLVLLLACFNVANLLLARAVEREREIGIRTALGAGPSRLLRLMVAEGLVLAILAGAAALVIASWTQMLVSSFAIPIEQPQHIHLAPDITVVGFILALVAIAGLLPGLWPALAATRVNVARVLGSQGGNSAGGRPSPLRRWLVGAQVAGSTAFLAIAALFAQSHGSLSAADLGFDRDRLVVVEFEPASHGYDAARSERYTQDLVARLRALPSITSVAVADRVPFFIGTDRMTTVSITGAPCAESSCPAYATLAVDSGYFKTMGVPLAAGREFASGREMGEVIINQPLARQHWPGGRALGATLRLGDTGTTVTVVGITAKTHTRGLDREEPTLYVPIAHTHYEGPLTIVARTSAAPEPLIRPLAEAAQALDPRVSLASVKTMQQRMAVPLWPFRVVSWLFSICGGLALVLATVGLVGVVIHAVNRRRREFGVRVSMGATPDDLMREVLSGSARLLLPGLVVGILLAASVARLLHAAFVSVNVLNPLTYFAVALLECAIVMTACISPALRASRVDPLVALRSEE